MAGGGADRGAGARPGRCGPVRLASPRPSGATSLGPVRPSRSASPSGWPPAWYWSGNGGSASPPGYAALATMASPVAGLYWRSWGPGTLLVRDWGRAVVSSLRARAAVVGLTTLLFPFTGEQPMPAARIWPPVVLGLAVTALAPRTWRVARWSGGRVPGRHRLLTYLQRSRRRHERRAVRRVLRAPVLLAACSARTGHGGSPAIC
ncbi:hypothetical protein LV779_17930 [Streptomyces thinghirensis]|nr:hypothetical protein [Streptomyces thinghirensis]